MIHSFRHTYGLPMSVFVQAGCPLVSIGEMLYYTSETGALPFFCAPTDESITAHLTGTLHNEVVWG